MRIAFCYNTNAGYENLGIESLSSMLKKAGHEVMLAMDTTVYLHYLLKDIPLFKKLELGKKQEEKLIRKIKEFKPEMLCFSVFTDNYAPSVRLAKILRTKLHPSTVITFGGIHATSVPDTVMKNSFIDYVLIGESEYPLLHLIESIEGKRSLESVPNLVYRRDGDIKKSAIAPYIRDIDSLPLQDKDLFYDKIPALKNDYIIMTGRGCPYKCTYCGSNIHHTLHDFEKNHIRRRSVENVIQELIVAKERYRPQMISFVDDIFVLNPKQWLYPFLEEYTKKVDIPYYCQVHPNHFYPELAHQLARSNCWNVTVGIQSGSPRIREEFFKRRTTNEKIIEACRAFKKENLFLTVDIIFGCPTENDEDIKRSLDLIEQILPNRVTNFYLAYYPNTEITRNAIKLNYLPAEISKVFEEGNFTSFDFLLNQAGEFAILSDKRKYWVYQAKMQILCLLRNVRIGHIFYGVIEIMPSFLLGLLSKLLVIAAAIKNFDRRGFQKLKLFMGRKRIP